MLLASDSNIIEEEYNIEDFIEKPAIPSIIITKDFGDIIREYYKYTKNLKEDDKNIKHIILNMKFSGVKQNGKVEIDLFFRSDDKKVMNFFIDFSYIQNPRKILLENIRQSCIYQEYGQQLYLNYMMRFGEICLSIENPNFSEECSNKTMTLQSILYNKINECMINMIEKEGKIEEDYYIFQKKKLYTVPDMYINGVPYRGSWYGKYVFDTICSGFLDDEVCNNRNPNDIIYNRNINFRLIFILIVIIFGVLALSLKFYKKYIDAEFENNFNSKIEEYTMNSISQYKPFSFNGPKSSKLEMSN